MGTAFLLMFVLALTDERNQPPKSNLAPLLIGLAVAAIGMSFGANAGYAINPARDFGPRFFAWLAGWGQKAFNNFRVVPPGTGIVHQVNLEYLAKVVFLGKDHAGQVAFPGVHGYFWVPIVGPLVGCVLGAIVYDLFVGDVLRARGEPPAPDVEGFGETEEQPTTADGQVEVRGRTVRER